MIRIPTKLFWQEQARSKKLMSIGAEHHYSVVFQLAVGKRIKFKLRHAMRKKKKAGYQKTGMRR